MGSVPRIVVKAVSRTARSRVVAPCRMASRLSTPALDELVDVVDHDDAVVDGDPGQHDDPDEGRHADRPARDEQAEDDADDPQRAR